MKDIIFDNFQNDVNESLLRHRSILDIMTKLTESNSRVNRALAKAVTDCGCINIYAKKQDIPSKINELSYLKKSQKSNDEFGLDNQDSYSENLSQQLTHHITHQLEGTLCNNCREIIENEIGNNIFYLTSLCNSLDLNLYDILLKEENKINILGKYTLR
ncbi:DUF1573 domain-containing protein [Clostridium tertium]|uniref:DUF1573 domain-containing protein n=1 Tax=Clostridium tertium TaxID=1559 RepID=A0A6N3CEZ0_9CLOT